VDEGERGRHGRPESQESRGRHMPQSLRAQRSVARVDGRHTEGGLMRCRGGGLGGGPAGRRRRSADAPRDTPGTARFPPPSGGARGGPPTRVGSKAAAGHGGKRRHRASLTVRPRLATLSTGSRRGTRSAGGARSRPDAPATMGHERTIVSGLGDDSRHHSRDALSARHQEEGFTFTPKKRPGPISR